MLGSSVHGALEHYVKNCYINKTEQPSWKLLLDLFKLSYMKIFSTTETATPEFDDGVEMLRGWEKRTDFEGFTVLSTETKENFSVKFPDGTLIPFNFIFDRLDIMSDNSYRIVDYKTQRWALQPDDLSAKIQARMYGLALQIKFPDAEEIWVEFDLLRHTPIGMRFTRDDNITSWKFLKTAIKRIYEYDGELSGETLNSDCRFCVRKVSCEAINKNAAAGGIFSIADMTEAIDRRADLENSMKAAKSALDELDKLILAEAKQLDQLEFYSSEYKLNVGVSSRRAVDGERAEKIIGPDLFRKYGSTSITLKDVDSLLKGTELKPSQKAELKNIVYLKIGEPSVKISKASPFDD